MPLASTTEPTAEEQQPHLRPQEAHPVLAEPAQVRREHHAHDEVDDEVARDPRRARRAAVVDLVRERLAVVVVVLVEHRAAGHDDARVLVREQRAAVHDAGAVGDAQRNPRGLAEARRELRTCSSNRLTAVKTQAKRRLKTRPAAAPARTLVRSIEPLGVLVRRAPCAPSASTLAGSTAGSYSPRSGRRRAGAAASPRGGGGAASLSVDSRGNCRAAQTLLPPSDDPVAHAARPTRERAPDGDPQPHAGLVLRRRALRRRRRGDGPGRRDAPRGRAIIDVGAESTRPGAAPVSDAEQLAASRVVRPWCGRRPSSGAWSRSTPRSPAVAERALADGAGVVNTTSLVPRGRARRASRRPRGAALVLMHSRGAHGHDARLLSRTRTTPTATCVADVLRRVVGRGRAGDGRGAAARGPGARPGPRLLQERAPLLELLRARSTSCARLGVPVARGREPQVVPGARGRGRHGAARAASEPPRRQPGGGDRCVERGAAIVRTHDVRATAAGPRRWRARASRTRERGQPSRRGGGHARGLPAASSRARPFDQVLADVARHPHRHVGHLPRAARAARDAGHADGVGLGVISSCTCGRKLLKLVDAAQPALALLSSIILIVVVRLPERHPPRRSCAWARARSSAAWRAAGVARHRRGGRRRDRAGAPPHGGAHRFEQDANLDEFVVGQGTPLDAWCSASCSSALFVPESVNKLHDGAVVIREPAHRQGGRLLPDARHQGPRQVARLAPPRRARHHRGDRRGRRRRERGARDHQLLLQRQHRLEPRRRVAPPGAARALRPSGPQEALCQEGPQRLRPRVADASLRAQQARGRAGHGAEPLVDHADERLPAGGGAHGQGRHARARQADGPGHRRRCARGATDRGAIRTRRRPRPGCRRRSRRAPGQTFVPTSAPLEPSRRPSDEGPAPGDEDA